MSNASMTLRASDRFRKYCCIYNHQLLAFIGLWPYQKLSKRLSRVIFVIFILIISILSQAIVFLTMELKMDLIIELMQTLLPAFVFFLCYCNMIYNSARVKTIFHRIKYDLNSLTEQQELTIMRKYAFESKLCLISIAC
ncbi:hypothetical protein V1478_003831 [Vespula squamosa]|uniref:Uncharacterized protein n=1 Tax=Vespula squamosa TaxID=30214 RepID=A0ABD2BPB6_VESSQ